MHSIREAAGSGAELQLAAGFDGERRPQGQGPQCGVGRFESFGCRRGAAGARSSWTSHSTSTPSVRGGPVLKQMPRTRASTSASR